jgi:hypothetical protein
MSIAPNKAYKRRVIRHRVYCGITGCHVLIGHNVWKAGVKRYDNGYLFEPNAHCGGTKALVCLDHAERAH